MQIILPCDNIGLRTKATQEPAAKTPPHEYLPDDMEQYLATVIQNEIVFHCKLEQTKIEMS